MLFSFFRVPLLNEYNFAQKEVIFATKSSRRRSRDFLLTQSSANATGHVCAAFRQENAFLLCNVPTEERGIDREGRGIYLSLDFSV